ncbi:MAG: phosphotransacetylase [Desulfobacula sp.]|uniref:phosphate acyltransferase n=1 Tax=Desulfobacula sp. TaxID=2593537 RepID=UPI0025C1B580|nr:phosphate acyltransferase [Desulfobacula sp.]MCD4720590.1 phosphotransacetylase [Desulfobacula sp.]
MNVMEYLAVKAKKSPAAIVFPEGENPVIQEASRKLAGQGLARPILLGNRKVMQKGTKAQSNGRLPREIIDPSSSPELERYIEQYCQERDMPRTVGKKIVTQPLCFAAMMVKNGDAGGMVAGIAHPTEDVIMASELMIGFQPGISLASSFLLMEVPGFGGGEDGRIIFADPAVNPDPDPEQLADIAISTAHSARDLLGWEPRVALLSFSTQGSASHAMVDKVVKATNLARQKAPDLLIDGEMQADTALFESVALKKMDSESLVAGRANVLIFPDLNSGNISAKLVQRLSGAASFGPVLQGFARPVSDLSRGATAEDVVGASLMVAVKAMS